jgi:predicted transcriptional regulator of viral defense system
MMEKPQKQDIIYMSKSKSESHLLAEVERAELTVFGVAEARTLTRWKDTKIHNTLRSLEKKGLIIRIKRNCYAPERIISENLFAVATESIKPSYISFWTALSHFGFTEQQVPVVQLVSTKQVAENRIRQHRIQVTTFKPKMFYGYARIEGAVLAEREKALVDSLYLPEKCGGLDELAKCLSNSWGQINHKKLIKYTVQFGNSSLVSRMGYLIESLQLEGERFLKELIPYKSKGYILLSPGKTRILRHSSKWRIIVNHEIKMEEII